MLFDIPYLKDRLKYRFQGKLILVSEMKNKGQETSVIFISVKIWLIILALFIITPCCYAQSIPLYGNLEVTDSIIGLSGFNNSYLDGKQYDKMGVIIWQLKPVGIPYIEGLEFYAKMEGNNLSIMIKSENDSIALRGLLPALTDTNSENSFLSTSPSSKEGSFRYDESKTLTYYVLQNTFEDLKISSAIPSGASLARKPSYKSAFSEGSFIFGYYYSGSDSIFHNLPYHNWIGERFKGSVSAIFDFSLQKPIRYIRYGRVYNTQSDGSRIIYNGIPWLVGPENKDLQGSDLDFPVTLELLGTMTTENDSAVFGMAWVAIDAADIQVSGRINAWDMNNSMSSYIREPDVLKKINLKHSSIIWPPMAIYDLIPEDGSRLASDDVLFAWRTTRNSSTELFYRQEGEASFIHQVGDQGSMHSLPLKLKRDTSYEFYAFSNASGDSRESEHRHIFIDKGVAFNQKNYEFDIDRDYSQSLAISVKNNDNKPHEILVRAKNPYNDIFLGFMGDGSLNKTLRLEPDEIRYLEFIVHAQDARQRHYDLLIELSNIDEMVITDWATLGINIRWPKFNIEIEKIGEDSETLVKKFRVDNLGDTLTDFSITLDNSLRNGSYLYPSITHYDLEKGKSVEFYAIPLFNEKNNSVKGNMTAWGAGEHKNFTLRFDCLDGRRLFRARAAIPTYILELNGQYCTNNPDIEIPFTIPPGFNSSDVISAKIEMDFSLAWDRWRYMPHDVYVSINGRNVGSIISSIPEGKRVFEFSPKVLEYGNLSAADNFIRINTKNLPQAHYVVNTMIRIKLCLKKIDRWVCATDLNKASDIIWRTPGLAKNYPSLKVRILSPQYGEKLILGKPVLITVSIASNETGRSASLAQLFADVKAYFSTEESKLMLLDDGRHGDGPADDGIYACKWIPRIPGNTTITVRAANCRSDRGGSANTTILVVLPDLNVTSLIWRPENPVEHKPVQIDFTVTNLGHAVAGPCQDYLIIDGKPVAAFQGGSLGPRENRTWSHTYKGTAGYHTIRACADLGDEVEELKQNNNCWNATIYISPRSDLNISNIEFGDLFEGTPLEISATITNLGNGTSGNHKDSLNIDGREINLTSAKPLMPKEYRNWRPLNYTYKWTRGNHTISACVDSEGEVDESNENNNCWNTVINIPFRQPDLNITGINFGDPHEDELINIFVNITNKGNHTAGNRVDRLSIDGEGLNSTFSGPLQPNETRSWRPLSDTYTWTPGFHIVSACADSNNEVNESNESNNCWNQTINVQLPDLNIIGINFSDPHEDEFINISVNIANQGKDTAGNRADRLSIDGTEINLTFAEPLQPNMTRSWHPLNDTYTWPPFYHIVSACVDSNNEVNESDESNNCWNRWIYIPPKLPDLNITGINFSDPHEGEYINISVNITNQGDETAGNRADRLSIDGTEINLTFAEPLQPNMTRSWHPFERYLHLASLYHISKRMRRFE